MKQSLYVMGMLAAFAAGANAQTQDTQDNHQAQAGLRIGRVFIGDTRGAVGRRLGKPTKTFVLGRGLTSQMWRSTKAGDQGARNTLEVVYRGGIVSQVEATSLVFQTPKGLSLSSSRSSWEDTYGKPIVSTFGYDDGTRKRYLDWKSKGIALELMQMGDDGDNWTYQTLIVHKKGVSVVPDRGGSRE